MFNNTYYVEKLNVLKQFTVYKLIVFILIVVGFCVSFWQGKHFQPVYFLETVTIDVQQDQHNLYYVYRDKKQYLDGVVAYEDSVLIQAAAMSWVDVPVSETEVVVQQLANGEIEYSLITVKKHWSFWSLLPAILTLSLCWITREPITALLAGIFSGALLLGQYNIVEDVLIANLMTQSSASMILIYLFLLGGLLGLWSKTGAAKAFAQWMTKHFVSGPRSAKLVAWMLGVLFFQGGTISVVLVGSTVKPLADKEKVSHEELAYIVDSTASPIASQLAFNAWPAYVQSFIFVSGVSFLATEADRIAFFFKSVPFCFYAIFAVLGTFLVAIEKPLFFGTKLKAAITRARNTGKLDSATAVPLSAPELETVNVPQGYNSHLSEFLIPLFTLIGLALGTFIIAGSPNILLAFSMAVVVAFCMALIKGMVLADVIDGIVNGMKSLILGLVILLCAMMIGQITMQTGAGLYLTDLLGQQLPYWSLPVLLQLITVCMAFSTGTSWGTYAVVFPIAMPLAWAVASIAGVAHPELFMTICFAAVMDGSVFGDQCSPISDTTVLSSMCTGCDLMDHVKTQIPQAGFAAVCAAVCWTVVTLLFV
tara:strand:+ start:159 stop:1937 length:1779 start_codon:yes stop_codon:yes gene_type:complete